jgi:hypothetical protein
MLPQIAPAGMDELLLCGSKAAFVQGGSERVPLPSSKPHVVRTADLPTIAASGSAWGVKVKRVKQELGREARVPASRSSEATQQGSGARATARGGAGSSGSTAAVLGTDQSLEGLAATRGGEELEGWGEDDCDALLKAVSHHADGATWLSATHASSSAAARRWPVMVDSVDDKENNPGRRTARGQDDGKPNIQLAPAHPAKEQNACDPHRPGPLEAARRDTGKRSRGEGTGGRGGGAARKDELIQRGILPRLTARSRAPSCPEPQDRDASRRVASVPSSDTSHSAKQTAPTPSAATRRGGGTGPGPTLTGIIGKGRLASTLPTPSSQKLPGSDDKTHMHALLSVSHVGQAAASVARRARSADDPPYSGAHGGGGTGEVGAGAGREDTVQRDMVKEVREKAPVDLAALMQKAKERIAAKKQKERQQMQEWEAHQERVKRERQEAKEGADAEVAQRRAAIYALNYLMHQQEWGAWLEFERAREREGGEGRERGREREGDRVAWLEFEREQKDLKGGKSRPSSSSSSASKRRTPALALQATTNPAAPAGWSDGDVPAADDADDDEEECLWKDEME